MRRKLLTTLLYVTVTVPFAISLSVETRRSTLLSWDADISSTNSVLGWVDERRDSATGSQSVTAAWGNSNNNNDDDDDESVTVHLSHVTNVESLGSSLWYSALAGAILCQSPAFVTAMTNTSSILELGAGLGLAGQILLQATKADSCQLTDNDNASIKLLQESIENNDNNNKNNSEDDTDNKKLSARYLEWRDDFDESDRHSIDVVLGTDVAYYFYLLRPLMDAARHFLKPTKSLLVVIGQAYRESQWDLHDNVADGCYNQRTDQHDPSWPGTTNMLLYRLEMQQWQKEEAEDEEKTTVNPMIIEVSTVPIAVLLHQTPGLELGPLTAHDHVATAQDREKLDFSF
jgi:SAM-dependent methyltransferase